MSKSKELSPDIPDKCSFCNSNPNDCMNFGGGENLCFGCWETIRFRYMAQQRKMSLQRMGNGAVFGVVDGLVGVLGKLGLMHLKMRVFL